MSQSLEKDKKLEKRENQSKEVGNEEEKKLNKERENQQSDDEITLETILEYLEELRRHLIIPTVVFIVMFLASVPFSKKILEMFLYPFRDIISEFVFIKPFESFWIHIKASVYLSLFVSIPFFIWRIWLFVSPALYEHERKMARAVILVISILFILGSTFGYFLVLPASLRFLINSFSSEKIKAMITISEFFSFCLKFSLIFGAAFQTPIIIILLIKTGLVERQTLVKMRPYSIVFAFIVSAIVTPTPDALTQIALAIPLIILWEAGIFVAKFL